jgi:hypothetical protein
MAAAPHPRRRCARFLAAAFLAYSALTALALWPLSVSPGRLHWVAGDSLLHTWALRCVARQAWLDPLRLFEANIYWPYTHSLAFNESALPAVAMAAPVFALGGGPDLAHNLVLLLTFPLSGVTACCLALELSRSRAGAFVAGLLYAFSAYRWRHAIHVTVLSTQWLPLVVLYLRRLAHRPRLRDGVGLGVTTLLQALSSGYYLVLTAITLAVTTPVYARLIIRRATWRLIGAALLATMPVLLLVGHPYVQVSRRHEFGRPLEAYVYFSATPASYLDPGENMGQLLPHMRWLKEHQRGRTPLFVGGAGLLLAAIGLATRGRRRLPLVLALTGFLLSLGPQMRLAGISIPGPFELLRHVPPVHLMRAPERLGLLALLGLALLAALGTKRLADAPGRLRPLVVVAVTLFVILEGFPRGFARTIGPVTATPQSAVWLARAPRGPVLELPWDANHEAASYVYWSTQHWQALVDGHGGFAPEPNVQLGFIGKRFPRPGVVETFRGLGIRYVVVHVRDLAPRFRELLESTPLPEGVSLRASLDDAQVYEIDPRGPRRVPGWIPDIWFEAIAERAGWDPATTPLARDDESPGARDPNLLAVPAERARP